MKFQDVRPVGRNIRRALARCLAVGAVLAVTVPSAQADEADARAILQSMSDYLAGTERISFAYDAALEVVIEGGQTLALVSSGTVALDRPNRIRATRSGGFVDVEMVFDGTMLTVLGRAANVYSQIQLPGTLDHLIDELHETYGFPLPAADLLLSDPYAALMDGVTDVKDLGSGVVGGTECDWFAFRAEGVDWQIWIAQGAQPYPCRYSIATKDLPNAPGYVVQIRDWRAGDDVATADFAFENTTGATEVSMEQFAGQVRDLPGHFAIGTAQ